MFLITKFFIFLTKVAHIHFEYQLFKDLIVKMLDLYFVPLIISYHSESSGYFYLANLIKSFSIWKII
jgi:hypothetical protein